jgi:hypothetical protein
MSCFAARLSGEGEGLPHINPKHILENLLRIEMAANHFNSHHEVLTHNLE